MQRLDLSFGIECCLTSFADGLWSGKLQVGQGREGNKVQSREPSLYRLSATAQSTVITDVPIGFVRLEEIQRRSAWCGVGGEGRGGEEQQQRRKGLGSRGVIASLRCALFYARIRGVERGRYLRCLRCLREELWKPA